MILRFDQEVQVVSNEDSETLWDNEEIGDKEMVVAFCEMRRMETSKILND